ncbi:MAG: M28 family metallopeptidase [Promethearchaeota archaeon]
MNETREEGTGEAGLRDSVGSLVRLDSVMSHLEALDLPRNIGSQGEVEARDYIIKNVEGLGLKPDVHEFVHVKSRGLKKMMLPLLGILWAALALLTLPMPSRSTLLFFTFSIPVVLFPVFVIGGFFLLPRMASKKIKKQIVMMDDSRVKIEENKEDWKSHLVDGKNLIVSIGPADAKEHLVLTAHYDSIATRIPGRFLYTGGLLGGAAFIIFSGSYVINFFMVIFGGKNFMLLALPLFLSILLVGIIPLEILLIGRVLKHDGSHGIIDDATGVAILLELMVMVAGIKNLQCKVTFCFFSGEEIGLVGSKNYFFDVGSAWSKDNTTILSVDMIGEVGPLTYVTGLGVLGKTRLDASINEKIVTVAKKLGIEVKGKPFLYPGSDFGAWFVHGYKTGWIINKSHVVHTTRDTLSALNKELVAGALKLCAGVVLSFINLEEFN